MEIRFILFSWFIVLPFNMGRFGSQEKDTLAERRRQGPVSVQCSVLSKL